MITWLADAVHNLVAHPLLFLTRSKFAKWLHDKTAEIAYPPE